MQKNKRIQSFILALLLILSTIFTPNTNANAATSSYVKSLKVNTSKINLISGESTTVKFIVKTKGNVSKNVKIRISKEDKKYIHTKLGKPNRKGVSKLSITAKEVDKQQTIRIKVTTKAKNMKQKKLSKALKVIVKPKETVSPPIASETPVLPSAPVTSETSDEESEIIEGSEDDDTPESPMDSEDDGTLESPEDSQDENSENAENLGSEDSETIEAPGSEDSETIENPGKENSENTENPGNKDSSNVINLGNEDSKNVGISENEDKENDEHQKNENPEVETPTPYEPNIDPYIPDTTQEEISTIQVSEIALDKDKIELESASKVKLTATIFPENAENKEVIWSSKDESVAKVDQNGEVTAIAPGSTEISVSTLDQMHTAVCPITVILMPTNVKATISKEELLIGETTIISSSVVPANATNTDIQYTSSHPEIAYVSSLGVVTAISPGEATIIAETVNQKKTQISVSVKELDATQITLNTDRIDLNVGDTTSLKASLYPENATTKGITWHSMNEEVATVNEEGVIRALSSGSALIRAYIEELNIDALCRIVVWRDDYVNTVTLDVMDDYTDNAGNVFHNTKLFHETMKIKVGVFKGETPQTYMPVELSLDENQRYGNAPDYFELSSPYIITDDTGYGYVEIKLKDAYKESNAFSGLFQSYVLHATETYSKKTASIDVRFASIEQNGITVAKNTITPSSNLKNSDTSIRTTDSSCGVTSEYVSNQQASYYEEDNHQNEHPVILSATPYIVLPVTRDDLQQEAFESEVLLEEMKSDSISNDVTNEVLKGYAVTVSGKVSELNIELSKDITESCKKLEIASVDCKTGEVIDSKILCTTETEPISNLITLKNTENDECYIVISGIYDGTSVTSAKNTDTSSEKTIPSGTNYLVKITGVQTLSHNEITIKKELEDVVTWTLVSKDMGESYQSFGMTAEEVKNYLSLDDRVYLEEEMTYTCRIPLAPYVGNAIIEAVNSSNGKKLYWAYPTFYKDNTIQLVEPDESICAFRISENEAFDPTGTIVTEGNIATIDSAKVGFSAIKATFQIPGIEDWNRELYTYIQWTPMEYIATDK